LQLRFQAFFQGSAASKSQCIGGGGLNFNPNQTHIVLINQRKGKNNKEKPNYLTRAQLFHTWIKIA